MSDDIERLVTAFEAEVYQAIKAAIETTRAEIDVTTLAEAIAAGDTQAIASALDIAASNLGNHVSDNLREPLAAFFATAGVMAATILGFPTYTPDRAAETLRDILRYQLAKSIWELHNEVLASILTSDIPPREAASRILQNIGLSASQQKSLNTFRKILDKAVTNDKVRISPAQLRRLSASQRSILRKALSTELTPEDATKLLDQQRGTMLRHRIQTIASTNAQRAFNTAQQKVWEHLQRLRLIDGYKRFWRHRGDERVRVTHRQIPGMNPEGRGLQEPFHTPLGPTFAPPLEVNCRCRVELRKVAA